MRWEKTDKPTAPEAGLAGPVKQLMQTRYRAHRMGAEIIKGKIEVDFYMFRDNYIINYDEQGRKTQETLFGTSGNYVEEFDERGNKVKSVHYQNGVLHQTTVSTYNILNKAELIIVYNMDGTTHFKTLYTYNDAGIPIEYLHYTGPEEQLQHRYIWDYNEAGKLLSVITYSGDGTMEQKQVKKYDERGNEIESVAEFYTKQMESHNKKEIKKYNEHNDCIEKLEYDKEGNLKKTDTYTFQYDTNGKKILPEKEQRDLYALAPGETEEFKKDSHDNWVVRTVYYNKAAANIYTREIAYFDKETKGGETTSFAHALENMATETEEKIEPAEPMAEEKLKWLAEAPTATLDVFSLYRYYVVTFQDVPSSVTYTGPYIEAMNLHRELKENFAAEEIHSHYMVWNGNDQQLIRYVLGFPHYPGYILQANHIGSEAADQFDIRGDSIGMLRYSNVYTSQFSLARPSDASGKRDRYFEEQLNDSIDKCTLSKKPEKPVINIIETNSSGFTMREFPVDDNFQINDLDINYGYGFEKFHNELMARFITSTKGLVLFHGEPGTGKTYYIRHLLRKMVANKKEVVYMPPNMVDHLVEPAFMTFLTAQIKAWSQDGFFCVLLIEDAEPLLARRQQGTRIQGITNLLNMSDGILNDMLNLQVICTFNVDLKKLDSALLRPGRLIARKEFKPLEEIDANRLGQRLGIKHHFTEPASLGEIYAMMKNKNTLVHDVEPDKDATTFLDDLL
jgi:hypothetical protein